MEVIASSRNSIISILIALGGSYKCLAKHLDFFGGLSECCQVLDFKSCAILCFSADAKESKLIQDGCSICDDE